MGNILAKLNEFPAIPDKLYFTISEASQLCGLEPHVLRFWEQEFSQIKPDKRTGNRRFYQQKDIVVIRRIKNLLYSDGFTIEGARSFLASEGKKEQKVSAHSLNELINQAVIKLENLLVEIS